MTDYRPGEPVQFDFGFPFDRDALTAAVDLVARSGATGFEVGFHHDDVPAEEAAWWARAQYRGARLIAEEHPGPVEAAEALAVRVLTGGKCAHCQGLIALSDDGAIAFTDADLLDGSPWSIEHARTAKQCRWRRVGSRWERGCEESRTAKGPSRFARSQPRRRTRKQRRDRRPGEAT